MKLPDRDAAYLWDMLDAAKLAKELSHDIDYDTLLEDMRTRYAVERALEIIGEAARRVSSQTTTSHPAIPWKGIISFRNVLAHEYGEIDYRRLFAVFKNDLPALITELENIVAKLK